MVVVGAKQLLLMTPFIAPLAISGTGDGAPDVRPHKLKQFWACRLPLPVVSTHDPAQALLLLLQHERLQQPHYR
jgi:hypothetical protein